MNPAADPTLTNEQRARYNVEQVNQLAGDDPIKIAIITPITGPGDPGAGEMIVRGACLGAQYVREHGGVRGGRQIEFVLYNDQATAVEEGMARSSAAQMTKAALVDNVVAAVGQWQLRTTPWVVDVATRYNVPIFVENGHDFITAQKRRNVFRAYFSVSDRVPLMMDFAASRGWKKIAMLAGDTVFGKQVADSIENYGRTKHGMDFLRINYEQDGDREFGKSIATIKAYEPDLFINGGLIKTNYLIMEKAAEAGLLPKTPTMVTFGFPLRSTEFWKNAGEVGLGVMWVATNYRPSWSGLTDMAHWFLDNYHAAYGDFPPDTGLTHFNDVVTIATALDAARSDSREDLLDALETMEFDTWRGKIRYEKGPMHWHHSTPEIALLQYQRYNQPFDESAMIWPPEKVTKPYLAAGESGDDALEPVQAAPDASS